MSKEVENYVSTHSKSQTAGFLLTLLLGPLGLVYSSWIAAFILCVITVLTFATIVGPFVCWILAIFISFMTVSGHNNKVKATANLMKAS